jgi:hypothetical protein
MKCLLLVQPFFENVQTFYSDKPQVRGFLVSHAGKGVCVMSVDNGVVQTILWDEVHVLTVNYQRQELYLNENAGSAPGELRIKAPDTLIRADLRDPFKVLDMAMRYAIRYELLARVLDTEMLKVFEQIGVKDFLDRLVSLTTEQMRRERFNGLSFFEFTVNQGTSHATPAVLADEDDDELDDEPEVVEPVASTNTGRTRRKSVTT